MRTFLDYYRRKLQPQIEMIDLFLKTEEPPYTQAAVATVLGLSVAAVAERMRAEQLACITRGVFFRLLQESELPLGKMLQRAVFCGLPQEYTPQTVAYIFGLPLSAVAAAAEKTGLSSCKEKELPALFSQIMLCETQYHP